MEGEIGLASETAYIDGSSNGYFGFHTDNKFYVFREREMTNNQAEWKALLALLVYLKPSWSGTVFTDSQLLAYQYNGSYKVKDECLRKLREACRQLVASKSLQITISWIPREENIFGKELEKANRVLQKMVQLDAQVGGCSS